MARATAAAPLLCLLLAAGAAARPNGTTGPASARAAVVFTISGRGWGHGVGMSQYGTLGFAQHGWTYRRILAHYFRGTEIGRMPATSVRVLLTAGRTAVKIGSTAPFTVRDATGAAHTCDAGVRTIGRGLKLAVDGKPAKALAGPLVFTAGAAPLSLDGRPYRGRLELALAAGRLRVVNTLALDAYVAGVVPREVSARWPAEALKTQAVAARSYALAVRKSGPFDLYPDTRSQVYGGIAAEQPATTAAVNATAGEVVLYAGRVATTYFFSTSGGRTASAADVWPNTLPIPYLTSVPDPYDTVSPYHTWGPMPVPAARLARALHLKPPLLDVTTSVNASSRVDSVTGVTAAGERSATGNALRTALGLRSTWFRVGMLGLDAPARRVVVYGKAGELRGRLRALTGVALEQRPPRGAWQRAGGVSPAADGSFAVAVKPRAATEYRLRSGSIVTAAVRLLVAPDVRLDVPRAPTELTGSVRPAVAGEAVLVQRRAASVWRTVAHANADADGAFRVRLKLTPGAYRARVAAAGGLVAGTSPALVVESP